MSYQQEQVICFVDIDDNLCHTTKKFRKYVGEESAVGQPCVSDPSGKVLSYRSAKQESFLNLLTAGSTVVPITGRSSKKYRQVQLGFSGYAIVSFGGIILEPDGYPEPNWFSRIKSKSEAEAENLQALFQYIVNNRVSELVEPTIISDFGLNLFLKVQHAASEQSELDATAELIREIAPSNWTIHLNENQLCAYPEFLDKSLAARYYLEELAGSYSLVLGSGDSLTDVGFMSVCDFMLAPTRSQIFDTVLKNAH